MKKSQTTSKSSAKAAKLPAKKTAGISLKTAKKTLKKPSQSKPEKKKEVGTKASASLPKALAKVKPTPVSPAKASVKKSVAGTTTKTVKKPGTKKPLKSVKETSTKLSRPKAKPAAAISVAKTKKLKVPEIKKTVASKYPVKKPVKSSEKITKTKKTPGKETVKTTSAGKSLTPGKKPAKKSPAKTLAPITKIKQKTTVKSTGTKKPSAEKVKKVADKKSEETTVKNIKVAARAEGGAKTEKSITGKVKPAPEKKPLIAKTVPQIKVPVKQKLTLKPTEKEGPSLSPRRKTVRKKGTSSLVTAEPILETSQTTAAAYVASSVASSIVSSRAETKQKKSAQLKIFLPEEELPPEEAHITPSLKLPEEYGENELLLMEVDPAIVFVSWEIKPDCISCKKGKLTLRIYDATGLDFDGSHANRFFDIAISKRVDSKFIDIKMPGRDVIMEIGLLQTEGSFEPIKRSNRVSMPTLRTLEELGITGALSGSNTLIGY